MGLLNGILGNATERDLSSLQEEFSLLLFDGEELECAYQLIRDKWVFTNKRLIMVFVQGVTGSKRTYHSIPYKSIVHFSIETSGTFDMDCEMKIWLSGMSSPFVQEFGRKVDVKGIQRSLASHVLL